MHAATLSADSYHRIAATGGSVSVSTESEQSAGQGYPPTWALRAHGIPVSLSMDTSVWWSGDLFSAMRTTLGADRSREHLEAHAKGNTVTNHALRAEQVVEWATLGGARALGRESDLGSVEVGKKADLVLLKNDHSPVSFPLLNPHGHVVFQAQRGDVHTVLVNGRVVKSEHRLVDVDLAAARRKVEATVEYLRSTLGRRGVGEGHEPGRPRDGAGGEPLHLQRLRRGDAGAVSQAARVGVAAGVGDEVVVRARLDDPAVVEHRDPVGAADRREPVGDGDRRAAAAELVERALHGALGRGVERAGRLVEHEHARVAQQRAGDRDALALAAGEPVAARADEGVVALRQARDQVVDLRGAGRRLDLGVRGVRPDVAQVLPDGGVQQVGLLADDADDRGEVGQRAGRAGRSPSIVMRPASGSCSRATSAASVLLPDPVSPTSASVEPAGTSSVTPATAAVVAARVA